MKNLFQNMFSNRKTNLNSVSAAHDNSIFVINPYMHRGTWVFDDPSVGLYREAFIAGIDTIIDRATGGMENAEAGFTMLFSSKPFPGYQYELKWVMAGKRGESDEGGNWYRMEEFGITGWLCPALYKYFRVAPKSIFIQLKP